MKIVKRIATMILAVCLTVPCFSTIVQAADGVIYFSDLETKVGDTFTITGTVVAHDDIVGEASVQMSYDTSYMQFMEGNGVNADSNGGLTFTGSGDGNSDRLEFTMTFQALQEGSTRMEQGTATVSTESGERVQCENGYADIKIGAGDPSKIVSTTATGATVTVDGAEYTISDAFSELEVPTGFEMGDVSYGDATYKGAVQENSGLSMLYLVDSAQDGSFWMYNAEKDSFSPTEEIIISDEYSIIIYDGRTEVKLPKKYEEGTLEINGKTFPIWSEPDREGFAVLYAVNSEGEKSLYTYDTKEHTYQRMETPKTATTVKKEPGKWDKIAGVITDYLIWIVVGVGCILVIFFVFLIVMAVKLSHRNRELDDLYDEYGIDVEEPDHPKAKKNDKAQFRKRQDEDEDDFDDYYDDEYDDEYYDDAYDDAYEDEGYEDDLADLRAEFGGSGRRERNYDEYYEEDLGETADFEKPGKSKRAKDQTFEMDFIDLE